MRDLLTSNTKAEWFAAEHRLAFAKALVCHAKRLEEEAMNSFPKFRPGDVVRNRESGAIYVVRTDGFDSLGDEGIYAPGHPSNFELLQSGERTDGERLEAVVDNEDLEPEALAANARSLDDFSMRSGESLGHVAWSGHDYWKDGKK